MPEPLSAFQSLTLRLKRTVHVTGFLESPKTACGFTEFTAAVRSFLIQTGNSVISFWCSVRKMADLGDPAELLQIMEETVQHDHESVYVMWKLLLFSVLDVIVFFTNAA